MRNTNPSVHSCSFLKSDFKRSLQFDIGHPFQFSKEPPPPIIRSRLIGSLLQLDKYILITPVRPHCVPSGTIKKKKEHSYIISLQLLKRDV
jgi:hypothetical protein